MCPLAAVVLTAAWLLSVPAANTQAQSPLQVPSDQTPNISDQKLDAAADSALPGVPREMLRMWVKFKEDKGRKVIDRATFQSFGCETAIAVASLATELIRGKTAEEALALRTEELAGELGPLPPMKIHCAQLVEGALRSALAPGKAEPDRTLTPPAAPSLLETFTNPKVGGLKITFLPKS
jgi:hypothetical protein